MTNTTHNPFDETYRVSRLRENFTSGSDGEGLETGRYAVPRQSFTRQKTYDTFKNKMNEQKAWAKSMTAKTMQAQFLCLAHNLMVLMEQTLSSDHDVCNTKETARSKKRTEAAIATAKEQGRSFAPMYLNPLKRSQLTLKFIRWLRYHLDANSTMQQAVTSLSRVYAVF